MKKIYHHMNFSTINAKRIASEYMINCKARMLLFKDSVNVEPEISATERLTKEGIHIGMGEMKLQINYRK